MRGFQYKQKPKHGSKSCTRHVSFASGGLVRKRKTKCRGDRDTTNPIIKLNDKTLVTQPDGPEHISIAGQENISHNGPIIDGEATAQHIGYDYNDHICVVSGNITNKEGKSMVLKMVEFFGEYEGSMEFLSRYTNGCISHNTLTDLSKWVRDIPEDTYHPSQHNEEKTQEQSEEENVNKQPASPRKDNIDTLDKEETDTLTTEETEVVVPVTPEELSEETGGEDGFTELNLSSNNSSDKETVHGSNTPIEDLKQLEKEIEDMQVIEEDPLTDYHEEFTPIVKSNHNMVSGKTVVTFAGITIDFTLDCIGKPPVILRPFGSGDYGYPFEGDITFKFTCENVVGSIHGIWSSEKDTKHIILNSIDVTGAIPLDAEMHFSYSDVVPL